ncbi:MAG: RcpC/CpaB family pilus assembly protein, partial [Actinomycetota bacterium]|nr:RcpC/CpaB family pilus assembly protein [Actinomycetota bacterium]
VDAALGAVAAAPLTAGEAITPARLRGIGLTVGLRPGTMAVTVVLDNPANAAIIHAGDIVDLLLVTEVDRAATTVPAARLLADRIRVLAALPPTDRPGEDRATLVVAADRATAARLAAVSGRAVVATLRAPP